jgi:hypothetical protein
MRTGSRSARKARLTGRTCFNHHHLSTYIYSALYNPHPRLYRVANIPFTLLA